MTEITEIAELESGYGKTVIKEYFIGTHCVVSAIRPTTDLHEVRKQVARLNQMPSNTHDPDFWKVIRYGRNRNRKYTYTAVRRLKETDPVGFIDENLLNKTHV